MPTSLKLCRKPREDVANAIASFASDDAFFISGFQRLVNGGMVQIYRAAIGLRLPRSESILIRFILRLYE